MKSIPYSEEAFKLLHDGAIVLAEVESAGMRIDVKYIEHALAKTRKKVARLQRNIDESDVTKAWRKKFRNRTNFNSDDQLGKVLFDVMGFESQGKTKTGQYKTDAASLSLIDHPFIRDFQKIQTINRAINNNLIGIKKETVQHADGDYYAHCFFNLHTVVSFRSSSSEFNFQNIPNRDEEIRNLVRRSFIARRGRRLFEIDFKGAEVCVSACYNKDPRLIDYVCDKTKDMHADTARELFILPDGEEVAKALRQCSKNQFVFAEFYGDWWLSTARGMWNYMLVNKLMVNEDLSLLDHLRKKGIKSLGNQNPKETKSGTFEHHVKAVEDKFWNERFKVYTQWKKDEYALYQRNGYIKTLSGFICREHMNKNQVLNFGTQGSAFHCLLWSMIQIVKKKLKKLKMKSIIIGQIHDSMVCDIVPSEMDEFIEMVTHVISVLLPQHFPWIIVPIRIDMEVSPLGGSWADKKPFKMESI